VVCATDNVLLQEFHMQCRNYLTKVYSVSTGRLSFKVAVALNLANMDRWGNVMPKIANNHTVKSLDHSKKIHTSYII